MDEVQKAIEGAERYQREIDKLVLNATEVQRNLDLAQGWLAQEDEVNRAFNAANGMDAFSAIELEAAIANMTRSQMPLGEINLDHLPPPPGVEQVELLAMVVGELQDLRQTVDDRLTEVEGSVKHLHDNSSPGQRLVNATVPQIIGGFVAGVLLTAFIFAAASMDWFGL